MGTDLTVHVTISSLQRYVVMVKLNNNLKYYKYNLKYYKYSYDNGNVLLKGNSKYVVIKLLSSA